ncbi:MAG: tRNA pseudouridine(13) synthase TruD [Planctomycetota bacterium]
MNATDGLPYATPDLPGIGGQLKQRPEDFLVDEQPLYEPCGQGEHLYLYVEKRLLTTHELIRRIGKAFRVKRTDVGVAGLKDKHAVTRQHVSVHMPGFDKRAASQGVERLQKSDRVAVLWAEAHTNKLRRGHHGGNRFTLAVRGVDAGSAVRAKRVLDILTRTGFPNYVGDQRFGYRQNSHEVGAMMLRGDYDAVVHELMLKHHPTDSPQITKAREALLKDDYANALRLWPQALRYDRQALDAMRKGKTGRAVLNALDVNQRRMLSSAWQSAAFNRVLAERVAEGSWARLLLGDVAWKHANRALFEADADAIATDNAPGGRVEQIEVSPSGPLWGADMPRATDHPGDIELQALAESGLTEAQLSGPDDAPSGVAVEGLRRPLREPILDPDLSAGADDHGPFVKVSFTLRRGAYATMVMREIMKPSAPNANERPASTASAESPPHKQSETVPATETESEPRP